MAVGNLKDVTPEARAKGIEESKKRWESEKAVLISGLTRKIKKYLEGIPTNHQKLWLQVYSGKLHKSAAIKAKCLDCACYNKSEITNCAVETCPLWHVRPYRK